MLNFGTGMLYSDATFVSGLFAFGISYPGINETASVELLNLFIPTISLNSFAPESYLKYLSTMSSVISRGILTPP